MDTHMTKNVWVTVTIVDDDDSRLAILVDHGSDSDVWIPRSQIKDQTEDPYQEGDTLEIEIPEWLALEKGMI